MRTEAQKAKDQVNDVVDDLRVFADLADAALERSGIAHNTDQVDPLQRHLFSFKCH